MQRKATPSTASTQGGSPQPIDGKRNTGDVSAILPVIECVTHRFLAGADIPYLAKKYDGMGRERLEAIIRFGCKRIIAAQRGELARLRADRRAA